MGILLGLVLGSNRIEYYLVSVPMLVSVD